MNLQRKVKKRYKLLAGTLSEKGHRILLLASIVFSCLVILISTAAVSNRQTGVLGARVSKIEAMAQRTLESPVATIVIPTNSPTPTLTPTNTPIPTRFPTKVPAKIPTATPKIEGQNPSQYTAQKIGENTWKVSNVANDSTMASPRDIFNALNSYRGSHGTPNLSWDDKLASFAQGRADTFAKNGSLDGHAGFTSYMNNGGFALSGFNGLGENSAYLAGPMNGERIIKNIFGADSSHDGNQLDPSWTHVGIGVNGDAVNVNFGKNKR